MAACVLLGSKNGNDSTNPTTVSVDNPERAHDQFPQIVSRELFDRRTDFGKFGQYARRTEKFPGPLIPDGG
jgi:hypothetical protein